MNARHASAPGKLFLLGEYGVLARGRAVVAAVNRRASGRRVESDTRHPSPVVSGVLDALNANVHVEVDTRSFLGPSGTKLGIGSSAAVAVVTAGLAASDTSFATLAAAVRGHRAAQKGRGSGLDVVSSFFGGIIAARRVTDETDFAQDVERLPVALPDGVWMTVVYLGKSASTSVLVSEVSRSSRFPHFADVLAELTETGLLALKSNDATDWLSTVDVFHDTLEALGKSAEAPIVTETMARLVRSARAQGAVAKPSGAGGGDVALVFGRDPSQGRVIAQDLGLATVDLGVDAVGLHLDA